MDEQHKSECRTIWHLCCALAQMCAAPPEMIVDQLTGYTWDEQEAGEIKANTALGGGTPSAGVAGSGVERNS